MKHLKKLIVLAAAMVMLTACGGKKEVSVDVDALAKELQADTVTSDTLVAAKTNMIPTIYLLSADQYEKAAAYTSSGATACEVAVVQCKEASQTADIEKLFKKHTESQADLFAGYNANEVPKLENAIIKSAGVYTVLCVCDDTAKANEILKKYGF